MKRARLQLVLATRALVYADGASTTPLMRELLVAFLDGGGYDGPGYAARRATSQRKLAQLVHGCLERALANRGRVIVLHAGHLVADASGERVELVGVDGGAPEVELAELARHAADDVFLVIGAAVLVELADEALDDAPLGDVHFLVQQA